MRRLKVLRIRAVAIERKKRIACGIAPLDDEDIHDECQIDAEYEDSVKPAEANTPAAVDAPTPSVRTRVSNQELISRLECVCNNANYIIVALVGVLMLYIGVSNPSQLHEVKRRLIL